MHNVKTIHSRHFLGVTKFPLTIKESKSQTENFYKPFHFLKKPNHRFHQQKNPQHEATSASIDNCEITKSNQQFRFSFQIQTIHLPVHNEIHRLAKLFQAILNSIIHQKSSLHGQLVSDLMNSSTTVSPTNKMCVLRQRQSLNNEIQLDSFFLMKSSVQIF